MSFVFTSYLVPVARWSTWTSNARTMPLVLTPSVTNSEMASPQATAYRAGPAPARTPTPSWRYVNSSSSPSL